MSGRVIQSNADLVPNNAANARQVRIGVPNHSLLRHLIVAGSGPFSVTGYNRAVVSVAQNIGSIDADPDGSGNIRVVREQLAATLAAGKYDALGVQVGDQVTIAGTVAYNGNHLVTEVLGPGEVILNKAWTADEAVGTIALNLTAAQRTQVEVIPTQAHTANVVDATGTWHCVSTQYDTENQNRNQGHLYLLFTADLTSALTSVRGEIDT